MYVGLLDWCVRVFTVRIFEVAQKVTPNIAMFVPKNVNIDQVILALCLY